MKSDKYLIADFKLCLEVLQRFETSVEPSQLQNFLQDESNLKFMSEFAQNLHQAWLRYQGNNTETETNLSETTEQMPVENTMNPITPLVRFKLANATVGKPYQAGLEINSSANIKVLAMTGLQDLGLHYDIEKNQLSGEPKIAGEHTLTISYQQADDPVQATQSAVLSLVINNDPKTLWKNIPSDQNLKYWKADIEYFGCQGLYQWQLAAASKRGRSHAHVGSCRDDDFALQVDKQGLWHILSVADGAGSSELAREGSRVIVHTCVEVLAAEFKNNPTLSGLIEAWVKQQMTDDVSHETTGEQQKLTQELRQALTEVFSVAINQAIECLQDLASTNKCSYREFYSTLLLAAHKPLPNAEFTVAYWIGDGGLALYTAADNVQLLGAGDSGDYAGQTRFLDKEAGSDADIAKRIRFGCQQNLTALVLMTDGITDPIFETDNNLNQLACWDAFWQEHIQPRLASDPAISAEQLTDWLDFWSPGNHDDRTIALLYR